MTTKLTLTIEQWVIEKAKQYAKAKEYSLPGLIENYLKTLTQANDAFPVSKDENFKIALNA